MTWRGLHRPAYMSRYLPQTRPLPYAAILVSLSISLQYCMAEGEEAMVTYCRPLRVSSCDWEMLVKRDRILSSIPTVFDTGDSSGLEQYPFA